MTCDKCKFVMDALDKQCPRCGKTDSAIATQTVAPDKIDKALNGVADFFLYPTGNPPKSNQVSLQPKPTAAPQTPIPPPIPVAALPVPLQGGGWFYSSGGQRIGPLTGEEMWDCIKRNRVGRDTLVWRKGMQDWCMARLSSLEPILTADASQPPPLIAEAVNNNIVWLIAFAPLLSAILAGFAASTWRVSPLTLWWIAPLLNSALCFADKKHLDDAGQKTEGLATWALFLVPVYLFMRAERLQQSATYAWVWVVMFILTLVPFATPVFARTAALPQPQSAPAVAVVSTPPIYAAPVGSPTRKTEKMTEAERQSGIQQLEGFISDERNQNIELQQDLRDEEKALRDSETDGSDSSRQDSLQESIKNTGEMIKDNDEEIDDDQKRLAELQAQAPQ